MDPEHLAQLLDRHAAALEVYAAQWTDAFEDVVQEAFLELVTQERPPERVVAWLYKVVRNRAISAARRTSCRIFHERRWAAERTNWFVPTDADRLDAQAASAALDLLPPSYREIVVAKIWGNLTFEEIAELTGTSSSTAHRYYQAALRQIREKVTESAASTATGSTCPDPGGSNQERKDCE